MFPKRQLTQSLLTNVILHPHSAVIKYSAAHLQGPGQMIGHYERTSGLPAGGMYNAGLPHSSSVFTWLQSCTTNADRTL
jgi:hypothetical protein